MTAGEASHTSRQEKAEWMRLCVKGDQYGATIYSVGQADEFYPTWHLKSQPEKDRLVALIKDRVIQACLSRPRYALHAETAGCWRAYIS